MGKKSWLIVRSSTGTNTDWSFTVLATYRPSGETCESSPNVVSPSSRR